jgi:hypothetical protein
MRLTRRALPPLLAVALVLLPTAAVAQSTDGSSVDVMILDVLRARGIIDDAQYEEMVALARSRAESAAIEVELIEGRLARLRAPDLSTEGGKPGKLTFKSADGKWSLAVKGRLQVRAESVNMDGDAGDGTNFSVARGRLGFEGIAGAEHITYKFEADMPTQNSFTNTSTSKNFALRDAYVNWGFNKQAAARFGQFKVPIGREALISSAALPLVERSIAAVEFAPLHEPGIMLHGRLDEAGEVEYQVALGNGQGTGMSNASGDSNKGLRKSVRVAWSPLGAFKPDGCAFETLEDGSTRLGFGASWNRNDDSTGKQTLTASADTSTLGLDAQLLSGPWSVLFDFYDRTSDPQGGAPDTDDDGHNLQVAYFIVPNVWEVVARTSEVDFDTADDRKEHVVGVNYYVDKHNGKWQLDLSKLDHDGTTADGKRVRLQYQLIF